MRRASNRPNIIFVLADQHRYASLPWTGVAQVRAPTLKRFRDEGVTFSRCYSNYPICSPARAMIMSGRWAQEVGFPHSGFELKPTPESLGACFARAGYQTGYVGKWHLHVGPDAGDDHCRYIPPGDGRHGFEHMTIWTETNRHWDAAYYDDRSGDRIAHDGYNATEMTNQGLRFLREAASEPAMPFFLWLSYNPPHPPLDDAPAAALAQYGDEPVRFLSNVPDGLARGEELVQVGAHRSNERMTLADQIRHYQAHITAVDQELALIVGFLEESGLASNTIVVYSSDHGDMLGSHGRIRKRVFYAESAQVPFLVWGPGRVPCGEMDMLFCTIDYYPTLLGLAGIQAPPTARGFSFAEVITNPAGGTPKERPRSAIPHFATTRDDPGFLRGSRGLRTDRYLYIRSESRAEELYDCAEDPFEMRDIAPDNPGLVQLLRHKMQDAMPSEPAR